MPTQFVPQNLILNYDSEKNNITVLNNTLKTIDIDPFPPCLSFWNVGQRVKSKAFYEPYPDPLQESAIAQSWIQKPGV